ncbi:unnamed protein product [Prunus armeniaca]|uniref:Uncharacterized protein n=1 Tax=Prunus armeniaca TaxID=36596 RepID=A0A6J5VQ62_PRUAR|nr:unnamed protein product [Prunus armeniaca]
MHQALHCHQALNRTQQLDWDCTLKKENTITGDIDSAETKPSKNDPNSSRSFNKSLNFSRFTSFFRPNATSPLTTTSNHDYHDIHDDHNEMLALRERVATVENLVEKQQLEIDTLRRTQDPNPVGS